MARPRSDIAIRIVHAARDRFLGEGVDGASLRQIASDAQTNIGMVYYYFPTKDDLFLAVVEEVYALLLRDLETALAPDASVETRLHRFYRRIGSMSATELLVARLILREALVSSSRLDRLFQRFRKGHIPWVFDLIKDGIRTGTLDPNLHPTLLFIVTIAMGAAPQFMRRIMPGRLADSGLEKRADLSDELVDVLLRGIGTKRAQLRLQPRKKGTRRDKSSAR